MTRTAKRYLAACASACLLAMACVAHVAAAENVTQIWSSANEAFFQGNLALASDRYQQLIAAGVEDADVYFNLGLAHARMGELGTAIADFERAQRLAPGDADTLAALAATRATLGKNRAESEGEATVETRPPLSEGLVQPYRETTLATWLLVLDLLAFGMLIARGLLRGESVRMALALGSATMLLGMCAAGSALLVKRGAFEEGSAAVVLHEGAELREGPDPRARARATAHEGARAHVLRRDGAFLRVRVANGPDGWMRDKDVAVVDGHAD